MKRRLISIDVTCKDYNHFKADVISLAEAKKSAYVCIANVHMLIEAYVNADFAQVVNKADMVSADGMPIAKGIELLYGISQDRISGMDLLPDLLDVSQQQRLKVFFYGGTQEMQDQAKNYVNKFYPNLDAVGFYSPPFRQLTPDEEIDTVTMINKTEANFVFVALGCPKQEIWMEKMRGKVNACMLGIGGALPVMLGMQRRAPKWMQNFSLEWLFRLLQEPTRLFRRYASTNAKFLYLITKSYLKRK